MAMKTTVCIPNAHHLAMECCCYNYDRNEIFTGARDCLIKVWDIESGRQLRVQRQHTNWVMDLVYVPSPQKMLFSCSLDGNILAWNERGRLLQVVEFGGPVYCLAWDAKQKQLLAGGRGAVQLFKVLRPSSNFIHTDSERKIGYVKFLEFNYCICSHDDIIRAICCTDKGKVFSTGVDRAICIFESDRPEETIQKVKFCHKGGITAATFDVDGKWLVTGAYDGSVSIWSPEGHCLDTFPKITDCVTSIAYITSTRTYWVTGLVRSVVVIDPLAPAIITDWVSDTSKFKGLILNKVFHIDGKDAVIGLSCNREIILWRYDRFVPHRVLHGHSNWIEAMIVARRKPYKERLLRKDTIDDIPGLKKRKSVLTMGPTVISITETGVKVDQSGKPVLTPNGKEELEMFSGSSNGAMLQWIPNPDPNKDTWRQSELCKENTSSIVCMMHYAELDILITGSTDSLIRIWNMDGQRSIPIWRATDLKDRGPDVLKGHNRMVVGLAACKNLVLVSASADKTLRWWNMCTRLVIDVVEFGSEFPFQDMAYSKSREELATCGGNNKVKVWNEFTHRTKYILTGDTSEDITLVKWCNSHDGLWITATDFGTVCTWDPITTAPLKCMNYKRQAVTALLVNEFNDTLMLCTLHDNLIHTFGLTMMNKICSYEGHTDQIHTIVYLNTRNQYLSSSWDLTLRVWLAPEIPKYTLEPKDSKVGTKLNLGKEAEVEDIQAQEQFELGPDAKPYVSQYEKNHPNHMPNILKLHMDRKNSGITDKLMMASIIPNLTPPSSSEQRMTNLFGGELNAKLALLEATLRPPQPGKARAN